MKPRNPYDQDWSIEELEDLQQLEDIEQEKSFNFPNSLPLLDEDEAMEREMEAKLFIDDPDDLKNVL